MYKSKVIQWGQNSQAIGLPKQLLSITGLKKGDEISLSISDKGNIVITKVDGSPLISKDNFVEE